MFIDERTSCQIMADLDNTVIHGTLRTCDLIPAFLNVIRNTPEYKELINSKDDDLQVIFDKDAFEYDERWDSEAVSYFLNEELFDILDRYAPEGYYFGSLEGDGSDFGYWKCP